MICYGNRTYCISPDCHNQCGRQLTDKIKADARRLKMPLCTGYFCGVPKEWMKNEEKNN